MLLPIKTTHLQANTLKTALISIMVGLFVFMLFSATLLGIILHKRSHSGDLLIFYTQNFFITHFTNIKQSLIPLHALIQTECMQINRELTSHSAFINNIRATLLVRQGIAYCSSATGAFHMTASKFFAEHHLHKDFYMTIIAGTPMLPNKPAITMWVKQQGTDYSGVLATLNFNLPPYLLLASRHLAVSGIALVHDHYALTTWDEKVIPIEQLPAHPLRVADIPGYPFHLYLYGDNLPLRDIHLIILSGLLFGLLTAYGCFLLLILRNRTKKQILLGIKRNEFHVEYQPIIEASSGKIYGLEALLRWVHPIEGNIPSDMFINYAESQHLMGVVTRHLFELLARDANKLCEIMPSSTRLSVNISSSHLSSKSFRNDVTRWINTMPTGHFNYIFELTERTMISGHLAIEAFNWLHQQGGKIAIDDFGTGHSALIYLEKFQFDYLKIDHGFVQSIGTETVMSPVLDSILNLAKKLHLSAVAEGVETTEQATWLINRGVTYLQGYFFARPMELSQLKYFLQKTSPLQGK